MNQKYDTYSVTEEIINSITHLAGAYVSLVFSTVLCLLGINHGLSPYGVWSIVIYGFCFTIMFTMSASYHCIQYIPVKKILKLFDHISIYCAIAGMYTPLCIFLVLPTDPIRGAIILGGQWLMVLLGTIFKIFTVGRFKWFSTLLYMFLGWAVLFMLDPILKNCPKEALYFLTYGGLAYTFGSIFYVIKKIKYFHCIWHICVLIGSILHFIAVLKII